MTPEKIGIIAGVISAAALIVYIISSLRGNSRPNRVTWTLWTVACIMLAASSYNPEGENNGIWVNLTYVILPGIIAIISIWYYDKDSKWTKLDFTYLGISFLSIFVWFLTKSVVTALAMNLIVDACGAFPTIKQTFNHPQYESKIGWGLAFLANILNWFTVENVTNFRDVAYPLYLFLLTGTIFLLTIRKK